LPVALAFSAVFHGGLIASAWFWGPNVGGDEPVRVSVARGKSIVVISPPPARPAEAISIKPLMETASEFLSPAPELKSAAVAVRKTIDEPAVERQPTPVEMENPADTDHQNAAHRNTSGERVAQAHDDPSPVPRSELTSPLDTEWEITVATVQRPPSVGAKVDRFPRKLSANLPPPYPIDALRAGIEGRVVLRVLVGADGRVARLQIESSSGFSSLDAAALDAVRRWRFEPARRLGRAVDFEVLAPVKFSIVRS
jgi:protein TonB